ncbi:CoA ester lyase, partial [Bordetella petrii]|nr:CoA ester lyase [Bordetella petrii]
MPATAPLVRPPRLRRSWMLVCGLDPRAQQAALASGADVLVADLAQIPPGPQWQDACGHAAALIRLCRLRGTVAAIRIG